MATFKRWQFVEGGGLRSYLRLGYQFLPQGRRTRAARPIPVDITPSLLRDFPHMRTDPSVRTPGNATIRCRCELRMGPRRTVQKDLLDPAGEFEEGKP